MKNLAVLLFALTLSLGAFGQSTNANSAVVVAMARAEVQSSCLTGYGGISSSVYQNIDGNYTVYFYQTITCPPNMICPLYLRIFPLAVVIVDENYDVIASRCWFSIFELQ